MNVYMIILMLSASVSLLALAAAVWYLVIRISYTLDRMANAMEKISDDAEETFQNINRLARRVDNLMDPFERMIQSISLLSVAGRLLAIILSKRRR
ncbi:MAG: hypothetical protein GXO39_08025 [Thermotogae bacterium]|nr:hypothetical protein [Thermotogota bacterium]